MELKSKSDLDMSIIKKITKLRHPGVLRISNWPTDLPKFERFNLIYGWNGSGKTTLSNLFRALELREQPKGEVSLSTVKGVITENEFFDYELPIRVFNRDFVEASVFPVTGENVAPIFVIGEKNVQQQNQVEILRAKRKEAAGLLQTLKEQFSTVKNGFDQYCTDQARIIRETLRSPGENSYNNYTRKQYRDRAEEILKEGGKANYQLTPEERDNLELQVRDTPKAEIKKLRLGLPNLEKISETVRELLQKTVVSSAIASLKTDSKLSSWVHTGLTLHLERSVGECLFCEQALPGERITSLEAHFNSEYEHLLSQLDEQIDILRSYYKTLDETLFPNPAEFYDGLVDQYEYAKEKADSTIKSVTTYLSALCKELKEKKEKVFSKLTLDIVPPDVDLSLIDAVNGVIRAHNRTSSEFSTSINVAREKLEKNLVAGSLEEFHELKKQRKRIEIKKGEVCTCIEEYNEGIFKLEQKIIEHRKPAEELNQDLQRYLGHAELQLEVKDTGYTIKRNGERAEELSEGEKTAISLLYFLKSLSDRRFDLEKGLIVLDDPVSSLDKNSLFLAFGFIRNYVADAGQVIILTHNFAMFRLIRNWFSYIPKKKYTTRFYMLECSLTEEGRRSKLKNLDLLLKKFNSEYHYLFACVYRRVKEERSVTDLEANYNFPNIARRLLEAFLAFRYPQKEGKLHQQLQLVGFDEAKKIRILRFLHTYSHADAISSPEHDLTALGEARAVLKDLLDLIKCEDETHFNGMVDLIENPPKDN